LQPAAWQLGSLSPTVGSSRSNSFKPNKIVDYPFREMEKAYTTFKAASENAALKMLITMS
jgi:hypothetical protein